MKQNKLAGLLNSNLLKPVEVDAEGVPLAELDYFNILYHQKQFTNMCGVSHDNTNHFFIEIPEGWDSVENIDLNEVQAYLQETLEDNDQKQELVNQKLEGVIGKVLKDEMPLIIVGDFSLFKTLFHRPMWKLWTCIKVEDSEFNLQAFLQIFKEAPPEGLSKEELKLLAKDKLFALLDSAS